MIQGNKVLVIDTGNINKCKQLTSKVFDTVSDEMVESVRHCLSSLSESEANKSSSVIEYTHKNHSSIVDPEDRNQVRVCLKVFLTTSNENVISEAVNKALEQLQVNRIESLIISLPHTRMQKIELSQIQPFWRACEELVLQGVVHRIGVADLDVSQLTDLYHWAQKVKPTTNQINIEAACNLPQGMREFATDNNIQLLSHGDDQRVTCKESVHKILQGFKDDVTDWSYESITRYTVYYRCRGVLHSKGYIVKLCRSP